MFTDASHNTEYKIGTWAMWAKLNGMTERYSGILKQSAPTSNYAELCAIANGLVVIKKVFNPPADTKIIIQSDSIAALETIRKYTSKSLFMQKVVIYIHELKYQSGWILDLRHVKGHEGTKTKRSAVNTWCDKACKKQMGLALEALENRQQKLPFEEMQDAAN